MGEGHDLDWLCRDPGDEREAEAAQERFLLAGNPIFGFAIEQDWPECYRPAWLAPLKFVSTSSRPPEITRCFSVRNPSDLEAAEASGSLLRWEETTRAALRKAEDEAVETLVVHPQVLGKHDPNLRLLRGMVEAAMQTGWTLRTYRDLVRK